VNEFVVSQHAEEAAFLWTIRERAIGEPHYRLADLARLDQRVDAHVDGLRVGGSTSWRFCRTNVDVADGGPGEVFALAVLAFSNGDREQMSEALHIGCRSARSRAGLTSALGWLQYAEISPWIARLLEGRSPMHRMVGIAACAIHRVDAGPVLEAAVDDSDPTLRARALRTIGEMKRTDLLEHASAHLNDEDDICRFWAAWSLALCGDERGVGGLRTYLDQQHACTYSALNLVLRVMTPDESRSLIGSIAQRDDLAHLAIIGAGMLGDPISIPWLIRKMDSPAVGRLAGEAFSAITGIDLTYTHLDGEQPAPEKSADLPIEEVLDLGYESNLPWPSRSAVAKWWDEHSGSFVAGHRYISGRRISRESLLEVLVHATQRVRAAAALELALLEKAEPLFEVRARGDRQQRSLAYGIRQ